jgi:hypothetical protein
MVGNAEFILDRFLAESWKVLRNPFRTIYREIGGDNPRYEPKRQQFARASASVADAEFADWNECPQRRVLRFPVSQLERKVKPA